MRANFLSSFVVVLGTALTATALAGVQPDFVPIFNGRDLEGWAGDPAVWRVENGAIVGESTPERPVERTQYLFWERGKPANFVLRAEVRLVGGNSGIQFRSKRLPDFDADGYQADYDAEGLNVGCLYQPARHIFVNRGQRVAVLPDGARTEERFADSDDLLAGFDATSWQTYEIEAEGSRLTLRLDGELMCEVDDRHAEHSLYNGVIALQVHQGPPMRVEYREISLLDHSAPR
ncbi:MAG: 3-keto-disaccharide hydrolase [Lacipirellulaceae bacterium]